MRKDVVYLMALIMVTMGCSLDDVVDRGEICPPSNAEKRDARISYIKVGNSVCRQDMGDGENISNECNDIKIQNAFKDGICPYKQKSCLMDAEGQYFCEGECTSEMVRCDSSCINPMNSKEHCGASLNGNCSSTDRESEDYMGVSCGSGMYCDEGVCKEENKCEAGQVRCGGRCINPMTDTSYCGATGSVTSCDYEGVACTSEQVCIGGDCTLNECSGDTPDMCQINGQKTCLNTHSSDAMHCGACNFKCADHSIPNATSNKCLVGVCIYDCLTGFVNVSATSTAETIKCIDPNYDNTYCGAKGDSDKGTKCTDGKVCVNGDCVFNSCTGGEVLCQVNGQNECKDINGADADHCGACSYKCAEHSISNAVSNSCVNGACEFSCSTGFVNVSDGKTADTIKCIDPDYDNTYCGAKGESDKGTACSGGTVCVDGRCVANSCSNGQMLCQINGQNACKDINGSDADHCGTCNYKCSEHSIPNAVSNSCVNGACEYSCSNGFVNVSDGKTAASIKCIDPNYDNAYCGAKNASNKGTSCTDGNVCVDGTCVTNSCSNGQTLCQVNGQNVCKNINGSDADHCGTCNYKCSEHSIPNAVSNSCVNGACEYSCSTGFVNVSDGKTASTIKCIDPKTDNTYCGAIDSNSKGTACTGGKVCVKGECVANSCSNGQTLCQIGGQNICKNIMATDSSHCGTCNFKCSDHPVAYATSSSCQNGICQYSCKSGYTRCGTVTDATITCLSNDLMKTDPKNCGSCGNTCNTGYCKNGQCLCVSDSQCSGGVCVDSQCFTCKAITTSDDSSVCASSINITSGTNLSFANLKVVKGEIRIENSTGTISFPKLTHVGSLLMISEVQAESLSFPELVDVNSIDIRDNSKLKTLSFPKLTTIDYKLYMTNNDALTTLKVPLLYEVSSFEIRSSDQIESLSFPKLSRVGAMTLRYMTGISQITFNSAFRAGFLHFESLPSLPCGQLCQLKGYVSDFIVKGLLSDAYCSDGTLETVPSCN